MDPPEEVHRDLAKQANARVWQLLDESARSPEIDAELVEAAYASLYHWRFAGSEAHRQRGLWLIAHIYTVLGIAVQAVKYAQACFEWTSEHKDQMNDFDVAYSLEGISRAMALAGKDEIARRYQVMAQEAGAAISDAEGKRIFMADFETGEWYGISSGRDGSG